MLNSACASHPDGLGNSSGLLGRYFMDQTISMAFGGVPQRIGSSDPAPRDPFHGAVGGVFIPRFQNLGSRPDSRFMRGFAFQGSGGRLPVPPGHPTPFAIGGIGEMLPSRHNRVTLNRGRTDAWGIPVAHIRCAIGDNERAIIREQTGVLEEMCEAAGHRLNFVASMLGIATKQVFPDAGRLTRFAFRRGYRLSLAMGGAIHECGGARMGSDPATSVLDEHNRCWDVPNLFVTDGSCFPSGGTVGPTLTIMAVTARACDHIAREHAGPGGVTRAAATRPAVTRARGPA
jgi:choline dehydrogenase-like flavoprotein